LICDTIAAISASALIFLNSVKFLVLGFHAHPQSPLNIDVCYVRILPVVNERFLQKMTLILKSCCAN